MKIVIIGLLAIIPLFLFTYQEDIHESTSLLKARETESALKIEDADNQVVLHASKEERITLAHQQIISQTNEFMQILIQDVDTNYKVKNIKTKAELVSNLATITTEKIATRYVDFYYQEKEDGLYIVPTETPPWFVEEQSYQKEWITDNVCKITQYNQSDLYGDYVIEIEMIYEAGQWKITTINHNKQNNDTIEASQGI